MNWIERLRSEYEEIQEPLEGLRSDLEAWLHKTVKQLGIADARIESRVKTTDSFVRKVLRKQASGDAYDHPITDAPDKIGIRADLVFLDDVLKLKEKITNAESVFEGAVNVDDKTESVLGIDRFGYQGIHIDVIPKERPSGLSGELAKCEIQVRTNAQAAWARAAHDLIYKAPVDPPRSIQRRINRLTVLLELFDDSVKHAQEEMTDSDRYPLAIVMNTLEELRMSYITVQYDRELTRVVISAIFEDIDAAYARQLTTELVEFCEQNDEKLQRIFCAGDHGYLLAQPESILVFKLLDSCRFWLRSRWVDAGMSYEILDALAVSWGVRLAPPH